MKPQIRQAIQLQNPKSKEFEIAALIGMGVDGNFRTNLGLCWNDVAHHFA